LASLETAANSYITCLPGTEPSGAAFRLQLSQSFNGIASFAGPFIASKYFFSGDNANNLTNVQWVYLAVALMGAFIAFLFAITKLPETSEAELEEQVQAAAEMSGTDAATDQPFYKVCASAYVHNARQLTGTLLAIQSVLWLVCSVHVRWRASHYRLFLHQLWC
jgi:FHS family L-fucose permease-like MFS transporter